MTAFIHVSSSCYQLRPSSDVTLEYRSASFPDNSMSFRACFIIAILKINATVNLGHTGNYRLTELFSINEKVRRLDQKNQKLKRHRTAFYYYVSYLCRIDNVSDVCKLKAA